MKLSVVRWLAMVLSAVLPTLALSSNKATSSSSPPPPIVYTIAGSDSGGGAGIQADLHAIQAMGCHGCSAITCLTAQNSVGVTDVHAPPASFLRQQLDTLLSDLPPRAVKIGMLGTKELAEEVGAFLKKAIDQQPKNQKSKVWVVLDPVMISTSGHRLIEEDAEEAMIQHVFPYCDLLTPNLFEAEALLRRKITNAAEVEQAAKDLLALGVPAVLIKGGHIATDGHHRKRQFAQDFFLSSSSSVESSTTTRTAAEPRLCDGTRGLWLRSTWFNSVHTHGTGCTLSSSCAAALALGEAERLQKNADRVGAFSSLELVDACCLAKAYVAAGIQTGVQLGKGPGPVAQTQFPSSADSFASLVKDPTDPAESYLPMASYGSDNPRKLPVMGRILPIVSNAEWVQRLCALEGVTDIQLRIKGESDPERIEAIVQECQACCEKAGIRLWINDFWKAAVKAKCFGVHVGQEDLVRCLEEGGLEALKTSKIALGISTHSFAELSVALGLKPSYISLGPVYATKSKKVGFDPQGLAMVQKWRQLVPSNVPFVAIGGIGDASSASQVHAAGADCVAVIGAVTQASDPQEAVHALNESMI